MAAGAAAMFNVLILASPDKDMASTESTISPAYL